MRKQKIVDVVNEQTTDGDNDLERSVNAYLTSQFIMTKGVPADECLREARKIIEMVRNYRVQE